MDFSVYIIQERTSALSNQKLFENLAGDVDTITHGLDSAENAVANLTGVDVYDRYADPKLIGDNGIAITGDMIESVQIKNERVGREVFSSGVFNRSIYNTLDVSVFTTITVKGTLFAPDASQSQFSTSIRMKNMARVMAWASLAPTYGSEVADGYCGDVSGDKAAKGESLILSSNIQQDTMKDDYANFYLRRVLVTVYSVDDMQFRAVLHDKVFVQSYEENYTDKDGNGTFTLVMKSKAASIFDVVVEGPTFKVSFLSAADEITQDASKMVSEADDAVQAADKIATKLGYDGEVFDKIEKSLEGISGGLDSLNAAMKDPEFWTPENTKDFIDNAIDNYATDSIQSGVDDAKDYYKLYEQLTPEQKEFLDDIPGYEDLPLDDKIKFLEKFLDGSTPNGGTSSLTPAGGGSSSGSKSNT